MLAQELVLDEGVDRNSMPLKLGGGWYEVRQGIEGMKETCSSWEGYRALFWEDWMRDRQRSW